MCFVRGRGEREGKFQDLCAALPSAGQMPLSTQPAFLHRSCSPPCPRRASHTWKDTAYEVCTRGHFNDKHQGAWLLLRVQAEARHHAVMGVAHTCLPLCSEPRAGVPLQAPVRAQALLRPNLCSVNRSSPRGSFPTWAWPHTTCGIIYLLMYFIMFTSLRVNIFIKGSYFLSKQLMEGQSHSPHRAQLAETVRPHTPALSFLLSNIHLTSNVSRWVKHCSSQPPQHSGTARRPRPTTQNRKERREIKLSESLLTWRLGAMYTSDV
jgi:hypothetical protein